MLALDASAATTLLLSGDGAEVVRAALLDSEARAVIHLQNFVEVFYFAHRGGALAAFLERHPERKAKTLTDSPDLTGLDMFDPAIFDKAAGDIEAAKVRPELEAIGVEIVEAMDAELWQDAAQLKSQFRAVSLADCFGVALARRLDAPFITSDRHELEALEAAGAAQFLFIR